ncbi:MAG TPA: MFS transporter [Streptosporangiaceae bacterium]|nr:MFS transporter [Streptosporangiaceae bacterium]
MSSSSPAASTTRSSQASSRTVNSTSTAIRPTAGSPARDRRNITLAVVLCAQLMIVLDMTVVNIALPSMATGLHLSATSLSWVLNAYALTFGGLLLLGGRAGDILGRRQAFMAGLAIFTLASLAGGLATSSAELLAARAIQGVGGAIASPAVLAAIVASFPEGRERVRALSIFTAVTMGGASLGLVLGGMITQWASWRWVFFVNVPVGIAVIAAAPRLLALSQRVRGRFDFAGAVTSTAGMAALVYAFIHVASAGWTSPISLGAFVAAAILLGLFLLTETRTSQPITPLWLLRDRSRSASYLARLLLVGGMFGSFFFLTQFVQEVLGFSPLQAGLSFIPMTGALFATSRLAPRLVNRFGPRPLMIAGLIPVVAAMTWLGQLSTGTSYFPGVIIPMLLLGGGMGVAFVPLTMASLAGVPPKDSGAAASMVNVMQQVGGALGLAILVTIFGTATRAAASHPLAGASVAAQIEHARVHGMAASFTAAAIFDLAALLIVAIAIRIRQPAGAPAQAPQARANELRTEEIEAELLDSEMV